ncbi:hypothetical protein OTU49_005738 [Cherax quadricarinatus]|uniref:non-specific serine/threonine protein kinase n=2 Tax=Cherax quadricarinatus TaxID=27406 RepID=A0AAW0X4V4_CHEQU
MKTVDLIKHKDAANAVRKEMCLHRMLKNPHIIKFYGSRRENSMQYMFLEYAAGGELFDRIEPDIGMPPLHAQKYFQELISGVEYLHVRGVAHRDIKPENLLLDENDRLKITDFGMATLFRHQGKERELDRQCGTKPYMAPEVLLRPYSAEPADIWSCGVVLVALLAGGFVQNVCTESMTPRKRVCSELERANTAFSLEDIAHRLAYSQPETPTPSVINTAVCGDNMDLRVVSFSQPAQPENLLLSQLTQGTQASQTPLQRLVKRMTRILVRTTLEDTLTHLEALFNKMHYTYRYHTAHVMTVTTLDRRGAQLVLKASVLDMGQNILVDFRLSKGCGLDFKRHFLRIKEGLSHIIVKGPVTWNMAMATNMLPA